MKSLLRALLIISVLGSNAITKTNCQNLTGAAAVKCNLNVCQQGYISQVKSNPAHAAANFSYCVSIIADALQNISS